jgi:hypothetical protein
VKSTLLRENAEATLNRVYATILERSGKYADTWRTNQFLTMRAVYRELTGRELETRALRALAFAAFVDEKHQRLLGGYDDDHSIDEIAYRAALAEEVKRVKGGYYDEARG